MHYAENKCAMPVRLHCNELRALCLTTNALCRTAEIGALFLKCVLIVYIWPEKGVQGVRCKQARRATRWRIETCRPFSRPDATMPAFLQTDVEDYAILNNCFN